jgi:hypothetical protein
MERPQDLIPNRIHPIGLPPQNAGFVGQAGLDPAPSPLSGFYTGPRFARIAPVTCAIDIPQETVVNRSAPMACGPNVDCAHRARGAAALRLAAIAWRGDPRPLPGKRAAMTIALLEGPLAGPGPGTSLCGDGLSLTKGRWYRSALPM